MIEDDEGLNSVALRSYPRRLHCHRHRDLARLPKMFGIGLTGRFFVCTILYATLNRALHVHNI